MKTNIFRVPALMLLFSVIILGFSNCAQLLEAFDIDAPFSTHIYINVSENDSLLFIDEKEIDLSNNSTFNENRDMIDNFTINEIYFEVADYVGEPGILGSGAVIFKQDDTQIGEAISLTNVDFYALYTSGDRINLSATSATLNAVQQTLLDEMKITIQMGGLVTDKPVYVDLEVFLIVTANVSP